MSVETSRNLLLRLARPDAALCAFNIENYDCLRAAAAAARLVDAPMIIAFTQPAAEAFGLRLCRRLCSIVEEEWEIALSLHLDHCSDPVFLRRSVDEGFGSVMFDGDAMSEDDYLRECLLLRRELGRDGPSLELMVGKVGTATAAGESDEIPGTTGSRRRAPKDIIEFARDAKPDFLAFEMGSVHGMSEKHLVLDLQLIEAVSTATGIPLTLHGSSGVTDDSIGKAIDLGVRKVNIETALRRAFFVGVRDFLNGNPRSMKIRALTSHLVDSMTHVFSERLVVITKRSS